ncbi:energy-converting hydrogenase A subunit M [Pseudomonas nitritireducens]|uniref:Energy-converting hydrogenase A subunit M n=1 Tax=Pseudomonas nitroreducens TaxID=46680 RepID=A0A7W7KFS5_PSENT|nr:hypothetical protein [Pseudomonas nitritireducens]MBB4861690.1 energy-converting hydrogenase A subunit M [Pseudomonas nitritireducens]
MTGITIPDDDYDFDYEIQELLVNVGASDTLNAEHLEKIEEMRQMARQSQKEPLARALINASAEFLNVQLLEEGLSIVDKQTAKSLLVDLRFVTEVRDNVLAPAPETLLIHQHFIDILVRARDVYGLEFELDSIEEAMRPMATIRDTDLADVWAGLKTSLTNLKMFLSEAALRDLSIGNNVIGSLPKRPTPGQCNVIEAILRFVSENFRFDAATCEGVLFAYKDHEQLKGIANQLLDDHLFKDPILRGVTVDKVDAVRSALRTFPEKVLEFINGLDDEAFMKARNTRLIELILAGDWVKTDEEWEWAIESTVIPELDKFVARIAKSPIGLARLKSIKSLSNTTLEGKTISFSYLLARCALQRNEIHAPVPSIGNGYSFKDGLSKLVYALQVGEETGAFSTVQEESERILRTHVLRHGKKILAGAQSQNLIKNLPPLASMTKAEIAHRTAIHVVAESAIVALHAKPGSAMKASDWKRVKLTNHFNTEIEELPLAVYQVVAAEAPAELVQEICMANKGLIVGAVEAGLLDSSYMNHAPDRDATRLALTSFDL